MLVVLLGVSLVPEEPRNLLLRRRGAGEAVSPTGLQTKGRRINTQKLQSRSEQLQVGSSFVTGWKLISGESNFEGLHLKKLPKPFINITCSTGATVADCVCCWRCFCDGSGFVVALLDFFEC